MPSIHRPNKPNNLTIQQTNDPTNQYRTKGPAVCAERLNKYKNKKNFLLQNKIKSYTKHFYKKVKFISNIEFKDLNLLIRKIYYRDRVLLFGDALHEVHPLAGQGFNMVLRDLAILEKTLKDKIGLGLDIGSSDILSEFSNETKSRNFVYAMGIDFLKNSFSFQKLNV